jgi:hypothetical protein
MPLNKERKVLLGLLGTAGLILVVDQLLLGPPQGASAGQASPAPPSTPSPPASDARPEASPSAPALPAADGAIDAWNQRLRGAAGAVAVADALTDPFAPVEERSAGPAGVMTPENFRQQHELSAVMTGASNGVAMINKTPVRVGETISGYRLISVGSRSAVFQAGEQTVRLELPQQIPGNS